MRNAENDMTGEWMGEMPNTFIYLADSASIPMTPVKVNESDEKWASYKSGGVRK